MRLTSSLRAWFCAVSPFHGITARPKSRGFGVVLFALAVGTALLGAGTVNAQSVVSEIKDSNGNTVMTVFDNGVVEPAAALRTPMLEGTSGITTFNIPTDLEIVLEPTNNPSVTSFFEIFNTGGTNLFNVSEAGFVNVANDLTVDGTVESTSGGIVLPDGTTIDDAGDLGGFSLPFSGSVSTSNPAFEVENTGSGTAINAIGGLNVSNGSGDRLVVPSSGLVGVNRSTAITGNEVFGVQADVGANTYGGMYMETTDPAGWPFYGYATNGSGQMWTYYDGSTDKWHVYHGGNRLTVQANGNVGIGTTSPSSPLTVDGMVESAGADTRGELSTPDYGVHGVSTDNQDNAGYFEMSTSSGTALSAIHRGDGNAISGTIEGGGPAAVLGQTVPGAAGDAVVGQALGSGFAGVFETSQSQAAGNPNGHVVLVENTGGSNADGLAVQAGPDANPGTATNFLTFYDGNGDPIGAIEGNGGGGVDYMSGGADFAEELAVADGAEVPEPADLVGVRGGEVSLDTGGADRVMIASRAPAVTGNTTPSTTADDDRRVAVAFVGQVPVRLRGEAEVGDLIVASGENDGTARAVAPGEYRRAEHGPIAGQAWSAKAASGISEVTVAVGLGRSGAVAKRLQEQQKQINRLRERVRQVGTLQERVARLEARSSGRSVLAGLSGSGLLLGLLIGGILGAGLLWRRRS